VLTALAVVIALGAAGYAATLFLLWRYQERIVFQPPASTPGERTDAEQVRYTASDGTALFGWVVQPPKPSGVLLYFHGNAVLARWMVPWARQVAERLNLAIFLAEYRGYDALAGKTSYKGSALDAAAAMKACCERFGASSDEFVVYGHSLGSAIAVELAAASFVRSIILEAPFTSARDMAGGWPLVSSGAIWPWFSRVHFDSVKRVREIGSPVHVVHGERDIVIPVRMGIAVHAAAHLQGRLLLIRDAGHNDVPVLGGTAYWQWLEEAVRPGAA
jgi:fermentation-respiration switch protein FrsA (DUF1100 family)